MGINLETLRPEPCVEGHSTPGGYSSKAVKPIALAKVVPGTFPFPLRHVCARLASMLACRCALPPPLRLQICSTVEFAASDLCCSMLQLMCSTMEIAACDPL